MKQLFILISIAVIIGCAKEEGDKCWECTQDKKATLVNYSNISDTVFNYPLPYTYDVCGDFDKDYLEGLVQEMTYSKGGYTPNTITVDGKNYWVYKTKLTTKCNEK